MTQLSHLGVIGRVMHESVWESKKWRPAERRVREMHGVWLVNWESDEIIDCKIY